MYGCESWTVKKAEHQRIDAFELWCWRRLSRVPWTARSSNQSILKEISPGCSLEGMMLKLKLQYFGHLMQKVDSLEKTDSGRDWGQEEKGTTEDEMAGWHHRLDGHEFGWTPGVGDGQGGLTCCDSWGRKELDTTERLNWTESICNTEDTEDVGSISGSGRSPGGRNGNPLQYSCLGNPMDRGSWRATVHGVAKSQTQLKQLSTHACTHLVTWGQYLCLTYLLIPTAWYSTHSQYSKCFLKCFPFD